MDNLEIKVVRLNKYEGKYGMKGFCAVELHMGDDIVVTLNSISIKEITKDGNTKLIACPPQQKNEKDNKYYDYFNVKGQLWWDISNAILTEYNGGATTAEAKPEAGRPDPLKAAIANKKVNPFRPNA